MKKIGKLAVGILALALTGESNAEDTNLYTKVKSLYEESLLAYPVDHIGFKGNVNDLPVEGCAGGRSPDEAIMVPPVAMITLRYTIEKGLGPLQPPKIKEFKMLANRDFIANLLRVGAEVTPDFVIDMNPIDPRQSVFECKDKSTLVEVLRGSQSGISDDGTSYDSVLKCKDGKDIANTSLRRSGRYLLVHEKSDNLYFYCWFKGMR